MLPVNWYSKLYFIKFSPFSSIQKSRKIIRISQDLLPGHFTILHYLCHSLLLLKVLHTRLKDLHILFAVNVHGNCLASSLRVSHLTKDTAIRACDTFDCHVGTVWIQYSSMVTLPYRLHTGSLPGHLRSGGGAMLRLLRNVLHRGKPDCSIHHPVLLLPAMGTYLS